MAHALAAAVAASRRSVVVLLGSTGSPFWSERAAASTSPVRRTVLTAARVAEPGLAGNGDDGGVAHAAAGAERLGCGECTHRREVYGVRDDVVPAQRPHSETAPGAAARRKRRGPPEMVDLPVHERARDVIGGSVRPPHAI